MYMALRLYPLVIDAAWRLQLGVCIGQAGAVKVARCTASHF